MSRTPLVSPEDLAHFVAIRQRIHANPELGFAEVETAELVVQELKYIGIKAIARLGGTGVVACIDSGKPGKTVALRAELDALPIIEKTNKPYQSRHVGKMHACGHDGHTTALLMTAKFLHTHRESFRGKVKLIFQPAEENCQCGAYKMIQAGVLHDPAVDAIFAFHNHPGFPIGTILTRFGGVLSSNTHVIVKISGKGGHVATPEHNVDPILIGAMVAQACLILNQQLSLPGSPMTVRMTEFKAGVSRNVTPDTAILGGTIRAATLLQREQAKQRLFTMITHIAEAQGGAATIEMVDYIPPTVNTECETALVFDTAHRLFGEGRVQKKLLPARASEDFAFYLEKIPGCYFFIGNGEDSPSCHNSSYDFNDAILPIAAELLFHIAVDFLMNT